MIDEECRVTLYQDYVTTALKVLAESYSVVHGGDLKLPSYIEMTHEKQKPKTAQQILDHVKSIFKKRGVIGWMS